MLGGLNCTFDCKFFYSQSVIAKGILNELQERSNVVGVVINFSAQTSSGRTQEIIESKLEKKRKTVLGEPAMPVQPSRDTYHSKLIISA